MTRFPKHTVDTAPAEARPLLEQTQQRMGFVPNLYAHLAEAPAALEAYFALSAQFEKTSLSPQERRVVLLAASVENGCEFCVAAHSFVAAKMAGVATEEVEALRAGGKLGDPRLSALATFTRTVVRERGWLDDEAQQAFFAAGFDSRQVLEVVLGVSMKTLSNYANHVTGTETNEQLGEFAWKKPRSA